MTTHTASENADMTDGFEALARKIDDFNHLRLAERALGLSPLALTLAYVDWAMHWSTSPGQQMMLARKMMDEASALMREGAQTDDRDQDSRFSNNAWQSPPFDWMKRAFQAQSRVLEQSLKIEGVAQHHKQMLDVISKQMIEAWSPSNWPTTNPEFIVKTLESRGLNWVRGYLNYLDDVNQALQAKAGDDPAALKPLAFEVGKDVAATPGHVIYRNHLIELIQYAPQTDQVHAEPLLIIPSCIMKYYILDLSPENSFIGYLVKKGHTVFAISWRNPDADDRALDFDDYIRSGVLDAMQAIRRLAKIDQVHALGYCLGGTFLSIAAAAIGHHKGQKDQGAAASSSAYPYESLPDLKSITLLAAQVDFTEPGALGIFIDEDQLRTLRETMAKTGYLSGRQMASTFQFLNSRDLVWQRSTRRYLMGEDEVSLDMMSWNADVTRLPERMHLTYLSELFLKNALANGHFHFDGKGIALMDIHVPIFSVGTVKDHVSPWKSVYKIHLLTDCDSTFVLAAAGHNAGIVSEPGHPRRSYQMAAMPEGHDWLSPEEWQTRAPRHDGSWWDAYQAWLASRSGDLVHAPDFNVADPLDAAPGRYVHQRYAD